MFGAPTRRQSGWPADDVLARRGATTKNADACAERVAAALGNQVDRASLRQNDGQWFLTFHFNRDNVRLAEIDAALKGSPVSILRDQLRLFGNVILEVDVAEPSAAKLLSDLKSVEHVAVGESKRSGDTLLVTLTLPAPEREFRPAAEFGKVPFRSDTFRHESNTEPAVGLGDLPSYDTLRKLVAKHDGTLQGLRWDCWGCRALGCVSGADADRTATQSVGAR